MILYHSLYIGLLFFSITCTRVLFIHYTEKINNPIGCDKESSIKILTHCNTGSLATGGYGTALGVIRALQDLGRLHTAFCTETRFCEIESM